MNLVLEVRNRHIHSELKLNSVHAVVADSRFQSLSQKTVDSIVETSVPFLENAVKIFYRDGIVLDEVLQLPIRDATIDIKNGFIRFRADFNVVNLLV